jgi:hypothetical protein
MGAVEHYDELGVAPTASAAEIRSSYLRLARRFHPDGLSDVPAAERAGASARMARINAAWSVLSDGRRRAAYDASWREADSGATVRDVGATWSPYDTDDDPIDPRLLDDTPSGAPTLHRSLAFVPAGLAVAGTVALLLGFGIGLTPLLGIGVLLEVAAGLAFLVIPLVALANSSRADRDSAGRW